MQIPFCSVDFVAGTTLGVCGVKADKVVEVTR